jgi:uncharacterized membrane protein YkvA (DUF1232 family)
LTEVVVGTLLIVIGIVATGWLAFLACLAIARPRGIRLGDAVQLVPDGVRLIRRLATDRTIPRLTRLPVWLLIGYLAVPLDVVPDFIPVIGYADDVIVIAIVLRGLIRRAGSDKVAQHWPGSTERLALFRKTLRLSD